MVFHNADIYHVMMAVTFVSINATRSWFVI